MKIIKTQTDPGPPGYVVGELTLTSLCTGFADPNNMIGIVGQYDEHLLFEKSPYGRYAENEWRTFLADLESNGMAHPITIFKEKEGRVYITEGNHRLRAAIQIGMPEVPVEIRYFGNSQQSGLVNI